MMSPTHGSRTAAKEQKRTELQQLVISFEVINWTTKDQLVQWLHGSALTFPACVFLHRMSGVSTGSRRRLRAETGLRS